MNTRQIERTKQIEERIDKDVAGDMTIQTGGGAVSIAPENMGELMEFAKMMATGGAAIRPAFRNNPGACLAVSLQAMRWGMDPIAVTNQAYVVKNQSGDEQIAFEAQLIHAVVNARAPLVGRLRVTHEGETSNRCCTVSGMLKGDDEPFVYHSPPIGKINPKNSPLWVSDPDRQLHYYSVRAWARENVPEVLMGVYTGDEIEAAREPAEPAEPRDITPRPTRATMPPANPFLLINVDGEIEMEIADAAHYAAEVAERIESADDPASVWEANRAQISRLESDPSNQYFREVVATYNAAIDRLDGDGEEFGEVVEPEAIDVEPEPEPEPEP